MTVTVTVRRVLARRPWLPWFGVAIVAGGAGWFVDAALDEAEAARRRWSQTATVWIAELDTEAGEGLRATRRDAPLALLPDAAADDDPNGSPARQRVSAGEMITEIDVADHGPTGLATGDELVVPVADPLLPNPPVGQRVQVVADGIVLANLGRVVAADGGVALIAVPAESAALVAAAAHSDAAAIVLVP